MTQTPQFPNERLIQAAQGIVSALEGAVLGQRAAVETLVVAFMAGGHALLEGVPGLGKTLLARSPPRSGCSSAGSSSRPT
jgi:MoxR-like ATPase